MYYGLSSSRALVGDVLSVILFSSYVGQIKKEKTKGRERKRKENKQNTLLVNWEGVLDIGDFFQKFKTSDTLAVASRELPKLLPRTTPHNTNLNQTRQFVGLSLKEFMSGIQSQEVVIADVANLT